MSHQKAANNNATTTMGVAALNVYKKVAIIRGSDDVLGFQKSEGCAIRTSRVLFFSFLLIAAGFLGWVVYRGARSNEVDDFETTVSKNKNKNAVVEVRVLSKSVDPREYIFACTCFPLFFACISLSNFSLYTFCLQIHILFTNIYFKTSSKILQLI